LDFLTRLEKAPINYLNTSEDWWTDTSSWTRLGSEDIHSSILTGTHKPNKHPNLLKVICLELRNQTIRIQ